MANMIKRAVLFSLTSTLFLLTVFFTPSAIDPAFAKITVSKKDCQISGGISNGKVICEYTLKGESTDSSRKIIAEFKDEAGNILQTDDCTINPEPSGYFCKIQIGPFESKYMLEGKGAITFKDAATGEIIDMIGGSIKLPGQNPCYSYPSPGSFGSPTPSSCPTALGNIPTDPQGFATKILAIGTGLGGAFAFILMVVGSIRVLTSSGDPKNVAAGRDMIVAAVSGLLFIIFSVVILRFIGIDILGLS